MHHSVNRRAAIVVFASPLGAATASSALSLRRSMAGRVSNKYSCSCDLCGLRV
nr:MAG TPA: hypothetical protein [Caudoviricetes sp.]